MTVGTLDSVSTVALGATPHRNITTRSSQIDHTQCNCYGHKHSFPFSLLERFCALQYFFSTTALDSSLEERDEITLFFHAREIKGFLLMYPKNSPAIGVIFHDYQVYG